MDRRIEPGYCWVTGEPTHEIMLKYPQSHALAGHVALVGPALPGNKKVVLIQTNGRRIEIVVREGVEFNLKEMWKLLKEAEIETHKHRESLPHYNEAKALESHLNQMKLLSSPPIGVL